MEVLTLALEGRVRQEPDAQIQITRLRAAGAVLALAWDANARPVDDPSWDSHVDDSRLPVVIDRQPPRRAVKGIFERQLQLLLEVAAGTRRPRSTRSAAGSLLLESPGRPAEEGVEEV